MPNNSATQRIQRREASRKVSLAMVNMLIFKAPVRAHDLDKQVFQ